MPGCWDIKGFRLLSQLAAEEGKGNVRHGGHSSNSSSRFGHADLDRTYLQIGDGRPHYMSPSRRRRQRPSPAWPWASTPMPMDNNPHPHPNPCEYDGGAEQEGVSMPTRPYTTGSLPPTYQLPLKPSQLSMMPPHPPYLPPPSPLLKGVQGRQFEGGGQSRALDRILDQVRRPSSSRGRSRTAAAPCAPMSLVGGVHLRTGEEERERAATRDVAALIKPPVASHDGDEEEGIIEFKDLEMAFRRSRRSRAVAHVEEAGRALVWRLEAVMASHGIDINTLMSMASPASSNSPIMALSSSVHAYDLRAAISRLQQATPPPAPEGPSVTSPDNDHETKQQTLHLKYIDWRVSEEELDVLMQFLVNHEEGGLTTTCREVEAAFQRAHTEGTPETMAGDDMMNRLFTQSLTQRKKRLIDLFRELDVDHSGAISLVELREGLRRVSLPPPEVRARADIRRRKLLQQKAADAEERKKVDLLKRKFRAAKESGALPVLLKLESYLHARKLRLKDIFSKSGFDKSGDGNVDDKEFERALDVLGVQARKKDVCAIMNFLDRNGDGMIQVGELELAMRELKQATLVLLKKKEKRPTKLPSPAQPEASNRHWQGVSRTRTRKKGRAHSGNPLAAPKPSSSSPPRVKVWSGDQLDLAWLETFDCHIKNHIRKLTWTSFH